MVIETIDTAETIGGGREVQDVIGGRDPDRRRDADPTDVTTDVMTGVMIEIVGITDVLMIKLIGGRAEGISEGTIRTRSGGTTVAVLSVQQCKPDMKLKSIILLRGIDATDSLNSLTN